MTPHAVSSRTCRAQRKPRSPAISPSSCDIQLTADGEAMVHHDDALGRLTEGSGKLLTTTAAELKAVKFKNTSEQMMTLGDLCALGRRSRPAGGRGEEPFRRRPQLVRRMAEVLSSYSGPVVGMSFDPDQVLALREIMPTLPRGIIAQRTYDDSSWTRLTPAQRDGMLYLRHGLRTEPHFVAFWVNQLPAPAPWIARNVFRLPAADLDRAHGGTARTCGALRRPDDFRGIHPGNLTCPWRLEVVAAMHDSWQGLVAARDR